MDIIECIHTRRSVRKFLDIPVEWDKIAQIISAGRAAPSAGNLQNYRFIVVEDEDMRKQIADACLQQQWIGKAPAILLVVDVPDLQKRHYGLRGEKLYSIQNCAAVIENMLLTAHALGLGACWVGAFEEEMLLRILKITGTARPQAVIPIGYPNETPPEPPRAELYSQVFIETYGNRIRDLDATISRYSGVWEREAKAGKKYVEKKAAKLHERIKPALIRLREKIKKKFKKKESVTN